MLLRVLASSNLLNLPATGVPTTIAPSSIRVDKLFGFHPIVAGVVGVVGVVLVVSQMLVLLVLWVFLVVLVDVVGVGWVDGAFVNAIASGVGIVGVGGDAGDINVAVDDGSVDFL